MNSAWVISPFSISSFPRGSSGLYIFDDGFSKLYAEWIFKVVESITNHMVTTWHILCPNDCLTNPRDNNVSSG